MPTITSIPSKPNAPATSNPARTPSGYTEVVGGALTDPDTGRAHHHGQEYIAVSREFAPGDRVQLTDAKGRKYTMVLEPGGYRFADYWKLGLPLLLLFLAVAVFWVPFVWSF